MQWKKSAVYVFGVLVIWGASLAGAPADAFGYPVEPVIQEVLYDAEGADGGGTFTELFGPPGMSLEGWSLIGINGANSSIYKTIELVGSIPANGIYLIVDQDDNTPADWLQAAALAVEGHDWQNGPDAVQLLDAGGDLRDALQYGDNPGFSAGEGNPAPAAAPSFSLSRDPFGTDTGDNAADFSALEIPTPGMAQAPLPAAVYLLGSGLIPFWYFKRRSLR